MPDDIKSDTIDKNIPDICPSDDLLSRWYEGDVTEDESLFVQKHLNTCKTCFDVIASLIELNSFQITTDEEREIEQKIKMTPQEQVGKILTYVEDGCTFTVTTNNGASEIDEELEKKIRTIILIFVAFARKWRFVISLACIVLIAAFWGRHQYMKWKSNDLTKETLLSFTNEHKINHRDIARPAGGFKYNELSGPDRSPEFISSLDYKSKFKDIFQDLNQALTLNEKNLLAHQILGTYFLFIEKEFDRAEDQYLFVFSQDSTNFSIINDLGVLYLNRGDYDKAGEMFSLALKYNPQYLEAQYNLSLFNRQQKDTLREVIELKKYLNLDSTSNWAIIAEDRIEELQRK